MARTATIGPEIFERVDTLVDEGKSRSQAFTQVGEERGSRPDTVSANYYRVARARGKGPAKRRSGATAVRRATTTTPRPLRPQSHAAPSGNGDIRQAADEIAKLTHQLVRQVEERDQKIRSLLR